MALTISKVTTRTSNGVDYFAVAIRGKEGSLTLDAASEHDADILVAGLAALIWPEPGSDRETAMLDAYASELEE